MLPYPKGFATAAVHVGSEPDSVTGAVVTPISLATTFAQASPGQHTGFEYGRSGNPTRNAYERQFAALENAKHGFAFGSGLGATTTLIHLLKRDDHLVFEENGYGGTHRLFERIAKESHVHTSIADFTQPGEVEKAIVPGKTKMLWMETPTNPLLKIVDIAAISAVAKKHGVILVVDNTFLSPYLQRPLDLGATVVMHSVSKYINGHSDVIGGVVGTNDEELAARIRFLQNALGAVPSPFDCYLASRGLKTLAVRMRQHCSNAMACARFLEKHPKVERVIYPGLESHPQHELAKRQQSGFGGMITFIVNSGLQGAKSFLEHTKVFTLAESLGSIESLAEHPAIMTHASVPPEHRAKIGISDGLVRLSVGIEDEEDLVADLAQALEHA